MSFGLNPEEVLGKQQVNIQDEGFASSEREILDNRFEDMYNKFKNSDFVNTVNNDPTFKKCKDVYEALPFEKKKQFISHCLIDMNAMICNDLAQINSIQQSLFIDEYSENPEDALDVRFLEIFLYQIAGLAFKRNLPGPITDIINDINSGGKYDR